MIMSEVLGKVVSKSSAKRAIAIVGLMYAALAQPVCAQTSWAPTATHAYSGANVTFRENAHDDESLDVVIGLKLRNHDQLHGLTVSQRLVGHPMYQRWLSSDDVLANYAPTVDRASAVMSYLRTSGFTNLQLADNRLLITATGTAAAIRKAFNTRLAHFVRDGVDGIGNLDDAKVPSEYADTILSVVGLQTLDHARRAGTVYDVAETSFPAIYDASSLPAATTTAVGIITEGSMTPVLSDLAKFESQYGLPAITPTVVNVGGTSTDVSNTIEWDLDSQTIQTMAGGTVKQMLLYTATSLGDSALTATYNKVVSDNIAKVINVSLQECETSAYSAGTMALDDEAFELAVAQGQTFSVASGDYGSSACSGTTSVSYPASSPYVIAVGGTQITSGVTTGYPGEIAWSESGGGPSAHEAQPEWQSGTVAGSMRGVPDIAFQAYAGTNVIVNGVLSQVEGTSLASPLFVGSFARLQSIHANTIGFPAAYFYEYGAVRPAAAFHDITSGSNGAYTASTGWDYVTGWGSLDVAALETVMSGYEFDKAVMTEESFAQTGSIDGFQVGEGSMSPAKTTNGYTYAAFADLIAPRGAYINTFLSVSGFASDPGATWLASATAERATVMGSNATYSYSAGTAKWKWTLAHGMFSGVGTTDCWIAHK